MLSVVSLSFPHHHTNTPPVSSSPGGVGEWSLWAGARTRLTGVLDIVGLEWDVVGAEEQVGQPGKETRQGPGQRADWFSNTEDRMRTMTKSRQEFLGLETAGLVEDVGGTNREIQN